jgi:hypothetical protein
MCSADVSKLGLSSQNFADRLLSKHHVAVVPGIAFGNGRDDSFQLRDQPGHHQEGTRSLRGVLQDAVSERCTDKLRTRRRKRIRRRVLSFVERVAKSRNRLVNK